MTADSREFGVYRPGQRWVTVLPEAAARDDARTRPVGAVVVIREQPDQAWAELVDAT